MKILVIKPGEEYAPYYAIVDDEDFEWLNQYSWYPMMGRNTVYARSGNQTLMHRLIIPNADQVDHRNRIGLDNRKENLRAATSSLNRANSQKRPNCSSQYKGVSFVKRRAERELVPWYAYCDYEGKRYNLGHYAIEEEAAAAYNIKAAELFGEFARLNEF